MIDKDELNEMIKLYNDGLSYTDIARAMRIKRTVIEKRCQRLVREGRLEKRSRAYKMIAASQETEKKVLEMAKQGKGKEEIAQALGLSIMTIYKYANVISKKYGVSIRKRRNPTRRIGFAQSMKVDSTLAPGETVCCNEKISAKCVYGMPTKSKWLCNYALITKECRSLGPDGCDYRACTKFSKIGPNNPRIEVRES